MPLSIHQFACLSDNYGFLARDEASGLVACIDTPDADTILLEADRLGWPIDLILNTHWHADHIGGNAAIRAKTGAKAVGPAEVARHADLDRLVAPGDAVGLGATQFVVIDVGGHTLGHIAYHDAADGVAFVGDAIFALGCGRLFEGSPEQMWESLQRIAGLPAPTRLYCAHEYTASNARFALSVDKDPAVKARAERVFLARERGEPTVPTTVAAEIEANPFLRAPLLRPDLEPAAAFAMLRRMKDQFAG